MAPGLSTQYVTTIADTVKDYLIVCGAAYVLFHLLLRRRLARRKITQAPTGLRSPLLEIARTVVSTLFGKGPLVVLLAYLAAAHVIPGKLVYTRIGDRGWGYFALTVVFDVLFFDLWFYLSHRFILHSRLGYKHVHIVHHRSVDPTPFARNSVHPLEGFMNGLFHTLPVFIMPHHPVAILLATHLKGMVGILGHTGYETFWSGYTRHPLFRYFISPVHHHLHHAKSVRTNFSFLINYDLLFGTLNPDYHDAFEEVVGRTEPMPALAGAPQARGAAEASPAPSAE